MITSSQSLILIGSSASSNEPSLHAILFDTVTGALDMCGTFTGIARPTFIVPHSNGRWLYAVSSEMDPELKRGAVWAFSFEREPFTFQPINHRSSGGDGPCHLQLDSTGEWLVVSNFNSGSVAVLPIQHDGSLGEMTDFVQHQGHGLHVTRQKGPHAHSGIFTPDNRFVIIADLGIDALVIYKFDPAVGKISHHSRTATRAGAGPRHMSFHPNGKWFYLANEIDNTVTLYDYDANNGALHERQTLTTLPPDAPENSIADIHVSASGQRAYVSNRGHNSIAVFDIGTDGTMTQVAISPCGGNWPRNFALTSDGRFILVANQYSNEVGVMPLSETGVLGSPVANAAVMGVSCIQFV